MKHEIMSDRHSANLVTDPIPRGWVSNYQPGLITVVIPTYNHERFLRDAVESALAQTYPFVEIIVVDDGSTDNTPVLMETYADRVQYIRQTNRGLSGARNSGILAARGEFIALLDADDFWQHNYLRVTHKALIADVGLGAVQTGLRFVDGQGKPLPQSGVATVPNDQMYDRLLDGEFFAPSAVVIRRWALAAVGLFDLDLRASEDWEIWLRVAHSYRFAGIAEPLLNYRVHGNNMSGDPEYMLKYQLLALEKHFGKMEDDPAVWDRELQRAFAAVAYFAAQGYLLRGDLEQGAHFLRQALEANPSLTESLSIFYELGCVDQPLGRRGDPKTLNLKKNSELVLTTLTKIFRAPDLPKRLSVKEASAFAHAYRALGTLAYNSNDRQHAQQYLLQAIRWQPLWLTEKAFIAMFAKTVINIQIVTAIRSLRISSV